MGNRIQLEAMGRRLVDTARTELMLAMRFMGPALCSLEPVMDLWTQTIGTDSFTMRYNPTWLMQVYLEHPYMVDRIYLHTILHCLFRHMFGIDEHADDQLWDLSCDISVESVIDGMDEPVVNRTPSDFREEWYRTLEREAGILTAERIYRYFIGHVPDYALLIDLLHEFCGDDHNFWRRMEKEKKDEPDERKEPTPEELKKKQEEWSKTAKRVKTEMELDAKRAGKEAGALDKVLSVELRERTGYRELLKHFSVTREECRVDPDSFDYGFYNYGMELYGNLPLIEENEFVESDRIRDLVIAIDTSASLSEDVLQQFLNETAAILLDPDRFFERVEIHLLECDTEVRHDVLLTTPEEMKRYMSGFRMKGGGGTDFRPVFEYIKNLRQTGALRDLKGLIYFSDGFGLFPKEPPEYETAFVFPKDDPIDEAEIPGWVIRVFLEEDEV